MSVTNAVVRCFSPACFNDEIEIHATLNKKSNVKIKVVKTPFRNDKEKTSSGHTGYSFFARHNDKPVRISTGIMKPIYVFETAKKRISREERKK